MDDRLRVCTACKANVTGGTVHCPFCGENLPVCADVSETDDAPLEESLASHYRPPYSIRNRKGFGVPDEEDSMFKRVTPERGDRLLRIRDAKNRSVSGEESKEGKVKEECGGVFPLVFLSIGIHLMLLSVLMILFARNGIVSLTWDARYWFLYCIIGVPAVYLGVRSLKAL